MWMNSKAGQLTSPFPTQLHTKDTQKFSVIFKWIIISCVYILPADSLMRKNFNSYLVLGVTFCQATEHACGYLTRLIFESIFYHNNHHARDISTAKKLRVIFGQVLFFAVIC
jgi:hypothetical protein